MDRNIPIPPIRSIITKAERFDSQDDITRVRAWNAAPGTIALQVCGGLRKSNYQRGATDIIATAHLTLAEARQLRDALNAGISELEE